MRPQLIAADNMGRFAAGFGAGSASMRPQLIAADNLMSVSPMGWWPERASMRPQLIAADNATT